MRVDDTRAIREILAPSRWQLPRPTSFLVHSPCPWEIEILQELWQNVPIQTIDRQGWDLNDGPPIGLSADVFMISGTMMYSPDPELWFRNISRVATTMVMQDLCRVRRDGDRHCTGDGDCTRYSVSSAGLIGKNDPGRTVFDLTKANGIERMVDIIDYGDEEPNQPEFKKFVTVLKLRREASV